jgi:hypothetical protein
MIRHLTNNEIDKKKWDDCVHEAFNGIIYFYSWYLDIVSENWEALVENDYERIFPLTAAKKWKINYLYQPVFTQQLGIISKSILTEELVGSFLEAIPKKFSFAEINLNTFNKVPAGNYKVFQWQNFELDLINSYENLYKAYSTNLKRNLKKADSYKLSLSKNIKPDEIIDLFGANRGKLIKNLNEEDYQKLKRISYIGIYKGFIKTYGVFSGHNELLAGAIFARSKKKMIFLFSGLSAEGKEMKAMAFLLDSVIKEHARQHVTLDFEGSNDHNLARFYQSFGSSLCTYPHIKFNKLPIITRHGVMLIKRIRKLI